MSTGQPDFTPKNKIESAIAFHIGDVLKGPVFGLNFYTVSHRFNDGLMRTLQLAEGNNVLTNDFGEAVDVYMVNVLGVGDPFKKKIVITAKNGFVYEIDYNLSKGTGIVENVFFSREDYFEELRTIDNVQQKGGLESSGKDI